MVIGYHGAVVARHQVGPTAATPMDNPCCSCKLTRAACGASPTRNGRWPSTSFGCGRSGFRGGRSTGVCGCGTSGLGLPSNTMALITSDCGAMRSFAGNGRNHLGLCARQGMATPSMVCRFCGSDFTAQELGHCSYHPSAPSFKDHANEGTYPCCGQVHPNLQLHAAIPCPPPPSTAISADSCPRGVARPSCALTSRTRARELGRVSEHVFKGSSTSRKGGLSCSKTVPSLFSGCCARDHVREGRHFAV